MNLIGIHQNHKTFQLSGSYRKVLLNSAPAFTTEIRLVQFEKGAVLVEIDLDPKYYTQDQIDDLETEFRYNNMREFYQDGIKPFLKS